MTDPVAPVLAYPWVLFAVTFFASVLALALILKWTIGLPGAPADRQRSPSEERDRL
jgi:hypothetical protein